jgi:methionyl-tRNA synthetase
MERFAPHEALAAVWELVDATNKYVEETAPWALAKRRKAGVEGAEARLGAVLYNQIEALRIIAHYCAPFLPATAEAMAAQLGIPLSTGGDWEQVTTWGGYPAGTHVTSGEVLFPRIEEEGEPHI